MRDLRVLVHRVQPCAPTCRMRATCAGPLYMTPMRQLAMHDPLCIDPRQTAMHSLPVPTCKHHLPAPTCTHVPDRGHPHSTHGTHCGPAESHIHHLRLQWFIRVLYTMNAPLSVSLVTEERTREHPHVELRVTPEDVFTTAVGHPSKCMLAKWHIMSLQEVVTKLLKLGDVHTDLESDLKL
ncbi:hypothetical protein EI94DRAFT_1717413 [Lactarius quietus]|nr:hypothetical protein EI94DRAFT_1717413 [Lactarius quietus]